MWKAVVDVAHRGGTYKAGYTTTCKSLSSILTTVMKGLEATLEVTVLARSTML
jgi:hypothetical protein